MRFTDPPGPSAAATPAERMPPMPAASPAPTVARLRGWERAGLVAVALLVLAFGAVVEIRSAFQQTRKTDFGVYARAGWAVRAGQDIFAVSDNNHWHYCYPPPFAVLMAPLADPPAGEPRGGFIPYAVGVAVWYLFSVACVAWSVHVLANAVLPGEPRGSRRWWYARTVPAYVCVGGIGATLTRGQVNVHLVALLCGMFAAAVSGRKFASGLWLAGAVALKVIPGYMALFPLVRREVRPLVGAAVGSFLLLGVLPAGVWGVGGAVALNKRFVDVVLLPGSTGGGDAAARAVELTNATATDSQSFQAAIHNWMHPDRATRPATASRETKLAHWAVGGLLTALTLVAARRLRAGSPAADQLVLFGCLCTVMMLVTPVSHMHYYALGLPLAAGLWLKGLADRPGALAAGPGVTAALAGWGLLTAVPLFPGPVFDQLREQGFGTAASVGLWAVGAWQIGRGRAAAPAAVDRSEPLRRAA